MTCAECVHHKIVWFPLQPDQLGHGFVSQVSALHLLTEIALGRRPASSRLMIRILCAMGLPEKVTKPVFVQNTSIMQCFKCIITICKHGQCRILS